MSVGDPELALWGPPLQRTYREMARALAAQGYEVSLREVADLHNYVGWRDAFDPHLTRLLKLAWTR